jgi:hypothetical protein
MLTMLTALALHTALGANHLVQHLTTGQQLIIKRVIIVILAQGHSKFTHHKESILRLAPGLGSNHSSVQNECSVIAPALRT